MNFVQEQLKTNNFIVQHRDKEKTTSHPRKISIPLKRTEKRNFRIQTYEILKHLVKKNGKKN